MKRLVCIISALLVSLALAGQNVNAQKNKKAKLEKEIKNIEKLLEDNKTKNADAVYNLKLIRKKEESRKALISENEREISGLDTAITSKKAVISDKSAQLDTLTVYYKRLIRNVYKNRNPESWYIHILSSDNLSQAFRRMLYLKNLSGNMTRQAREIKQVREELQNSVEEMTELRAQADKLREENRAELAKLKEEEAQSQKIIKDLNRDKSKYEKQLASKKKQVSALNKEIQRLIAEAMASSKKKSSSTKGKTQADTKLSAEFSANMGKLPWPAEGTLVDRFGKHKHPVYTNLEMPFNNGVSLAVAPGTKAKAVFKGVVKNIVLMPGYNQCVLVEHGGYFTFYCKLGSVAVKTGDTVQGGQTIGTVAAQEGQPQLHFQLWKGNQPQNPEAWLLPL